MAESLADSAAVVFEVFVVGPSVGDAGGRGCSQIRREVVIVAERSRPGNPFVHRAQSAGCGMRVEEPGSRHLNHFGVVGNPWIPA